MKKTVAGVLFATVTVLGSSLAFASGVDKVDIQGVSFGIPEEIRDLVTVDAQGLPQDVLVSVSETASVEAAVELGEDREGAGWIFSISTVPEDELKELRCGGMDGTEVFAEDDDIYYLFNHPTDVRLVRANNEEMEEAQEQWTMINEWAGQEVRQEILANNPELDSEFYTNTDLDMHLARAAYQPGTKYELRSLEYGPDALDPSTLDEDDYIEDLAEDFTYEVLPDAEVPDGEYYVLAFEEEGGEVRFDFFESPDGKNLVREVITLENEEEYEIIYQANVKDAEDADKTTTDIVAAWCAAIANGGEVDDD